MIDNLTEAIAHCKEKAEELKNMGFDVNTRFNADTKKGRECYEYAAEHEQLADWLTELQERREADRWIPVSERLPEKEGNKAYLVTVDYGNGIVSSCQRFFFGEGIGWNDDCVIAWKPLPKPYESEDK